MRVRTTTTKNMPWQCRLRLDAFVRQPFWKHLRALRTVIHADFVINLNLVYNTVEKETTRPWCEKHTAKLWNNSQIC